jgi:ERCC4-type nuclease
MDLIIDSRENSTLCSFIETKARKLAIKTHKKWLEVGDYVIGDVCFEAKSSPDFLLSVLNKRLWTQVDNMDRSYNKNFVCIHGTISEAMKTTRYIKSFDDVPQETREQLYAMRFKGAIGRLRLDYDIEVIWHRDAESLADEIVTLAKMVPVDRQVISPSIPKRISTGDVRIDMLTIIKGVSDKKAKALLKKHGCILEIGDCNINELTVVKGIGDTVANRIVKILNSEKKVKQ